MRDIVRRKEGPRAPLFRLLTALLLFPAMGFAQDAIDRSELARCAALLDAADRLACFESLAADTLPPAEDAESAPVIVEAQPPAPVPRVPQGQQPPEPADEPVRRNDMPPDRAKPGRQSAPDDLGAEHLVRAEEQERPDTVSTTVEEVWKGGNRLLYFRFANGQIWRQMESGYFHYPRDSAFDVTIRQGFMGDYQMRRTGSARMTRIVRVK